MRHPTPQSSGAGPRILFLASYFPKPANPRMGVWALAQARAMVERGVDLTVASFTSYVPRILGRLGIKPAWALCPREHTFEGGVRVEYPRWLYYTTYNLKTGYEDPRRSAAICWRTGRGALRRLVDRIRPDVIFCHHTLFNGYMACRLREETGIPYVITDHDFDEIADCEKFPRRHEVFDLVASNAFCSVTVAERMERDIRRLFPRARPRTVHNGTPPIPEAILNAPRPPALRDKVVITSICIFAARKGLPVLVRGFAKVAGKHPDAVLRLVGDGADRPHVEAAIRETGMESRVEILGLMDHAEAMRQLAWSDIFASIGWDEPFATVLLEAAAAGKPSLWGADGGINDVLRTGEHGLAVRTRDVEAAAEALDRLLSSRDERERMGRAARALHASSLTWDANVRTMREIFAAAAAERAGAAKARSA